VLNQPAAKNNYFARKSVEELIASGAAESKGMVRSLGPISLMALGVGGIIGTGIFVLTGTVAAHNAGPGVVLSFALAGIVSAFVALCYAELASLIPVSGSTYTYTYATLGEIFAWIIGWDLILEYGMGAATVAVGWSGYFANMMRSIGLALPPELTAAYFADPIKLADGSTVHGMFNLPAAAIILLLTALLVRGTKESARFNNIIVAFKVFVVIAVIVVGASFVNTANWSPFIPENTGTFGEYGWSGVFRGASLVFFAYVGFDAVSTAAQEAHNPQRDMPIGLLGSLALCTVLYLLVAAIVTGLVPYKTLGVPDPIAVAVDATGLKWLALIVKLGALAGLTTTMLVLLYGQTRVFFTMSHDGLLPPMFAKLHREWRTPAVSQTLVGVAGALVAGVTPIRELAEMVNIGTLSAFVLVCGAVIYLRRESPDLHRPFRAPAVPVMPVLGIFSSLALMAALPLLTWGVFIAWMLIGFVIYFGYARVSGRFH
jgi:basic amino acid/polyamine antiporter, APA family